MRSAIGIAVLAGLLVILWKLWPAAAIDSALQPTRPETLKHADEERAGPAANALRVLFVGNSHTYYNTMPRMIGALAAGAERPFQFVMEAKSGANLAQHLERGQVSRHLDKGRFDYVVLQEQQQRPSFTFNRAQLEQEFFAPTRTLDVIVRAAGARTVLFMNWARRNGDPDNVQNDTYEQMQERTHQSHLNIARELDAVIAPVGLAWRSALSDRPDLPLWRKDGSHATMHGSYLAACVFYGVFYGRPALGNAYAAELPPDDVSLLQRAADRSRER